MTAEPERALNRRAVNRRAVNGRRAAQFHRSAARTCR